MHRRTLQFHSENIGRRLPTTKNEGGDQD